MSSSNPESDDEPHCRITCTKFYRLTNSGPLIGFADLHLPAPYRMQLYNCPCFMHDGVISVLLPNKPVLSLDGRHARDEAGKPKYEPVIAFDNQRRHARFSSAAAGAVRRHVPEFRGDDD
ncbi:hypothetical protein FHX16_006330 [Rhizobium sp. BK661]|nr:hypothetical protein [Rhizobium sp. BK661]